MVTDGDAVFRGQEAVAWASGRKAEKLVSSRKADLIGMRSQGFGRISPPSYLLGGQGCERQVENPELPLTARAYRVAHLGVNRLVFLVGALEILDLVVIEVPDAGRRFVDQIVVVGHQQHRPLDISAARCSVR